MIKLSYIAKRVVGLLTRRIEHRFIALGSFFKLTDCVAERALKLGLRVGSDAFKFAVQLSSLANDAGEFLWTQNDQSQDHQEEDLASREIKHLDSLNLDPSGYA